MGVIFAFSSKLLVSVGMTHTAPTPQKLMLTMRVLCPLATSIDPSKDGGHAEDTEGTPLEHLAPVAWKGCF